MRTTHSARPIVVAIPVLGRPQNAQAVLQSLELSDPGGLCRPLFVCSPGDGRQIRACHETGAQVLIAKWPSGLGDYQRKINLAVRLTSEPFIFTGADDLTFHPGWAEAALYVADRDEVGMVGTDDLGNGLVRQGKHSTHSLFARWYVEQCGTVDEAGKIYHEGYGHQQCDVEAYETAVVRGCFSFAADSRVEHLHPFWGKGDRDDTYTKGLSTSDADRALYLQRKPMWRDMAA
jgi:hypothetical protein